MVNVSRLSEECDICTFVMSNMKLKVFSNRFCTVLFHPEPAAVGHLVVVPNAHKPIFEAISDQRLSSMAVIAAHFSKLIIEETKATGTNILIQNGIPAGQDHAHFMIHVIPRVEGDSIDLTWKSEEETEDKLNAMKRRLSAMHSLSHEERWDPPSGFSDADRTP